MSNETTITADDGTARTERYRMITTVLDWRAAPAPGLAGVAFTLPVMNQIAALLPIAVVDRLGQPARPD